MSYIVVQCSCETPNHTMSLCAGFDADQKGGSRRTFMIGQPNAPRDPKRRSCFLFTESIIIIIIIIIIIAKVN